MTKITFLGAGSVVFVKNIIGDCLLCPELQTAEFALYDIDATRLGEARLLVERLNENLAGGSAKVSVFLGKKNLRAALKNASYVINAVQVGGYKPCTVTDFEIPKKYGLRQTIGDTLGIGGIFRALRTAPVMLEFARTMEDVAPDAWFLNYTNPMAILTGVMLRGSGIKTVGLCHSVQECADLLLKELDLRGQVDDLMWTIAGINHMAWLLDIRDGKKDLYPEIKKRAASVFALAKRGSVEGLRRHYARKEGKDFRWWLSPHYKRDTDLVRFETMLHFGYYPTESSEHHAEYTPYWIKSHKPHLVREYNIPLDEYIRRCEEQARDCKKQGEQILGDKNITHERSIEYGSRIMQAMENGVPFRIHGNVANTGLITNLPEKAIVEVPCLVDKNGVQPCFFGGLPEQCAALNRTNINVQILAIEAALTLEREKIYHAASLDPHTGAELTLKEIRSLCDDLIRAHGRWLPKFK